MASTKLTGTHFVCIGKQPAKDIDSRRINSVFLRDDEAIFKDDNGDFVQFMPVAPYTPYYP